jgi:type II secretory pathway predicted ATPase ExeA
MVFLLSSIDSVLSYAANWISDQTMLKKKIAQNGERDLAEQLSTIKQEREFKAAEQRWLARYPTQEAQEIEISRYLEAEFPLGKPPSDLAKRMAILNFKQS